MMFKKKMHVYLTKDYDNNINYDRLVKCYSIIENKYLIKLERVSYDTNTKEFKAEKVITLATLDKIQNSIHYVGLRRDNDKDK